MDDKRIRIICGHYGSGKSEFSVNYTKILNTMDKKVALVDLDVVNPYFRSREKAKELEELGIRVISSSIKGSNADLPALSGEINAPLVDKSYDLIIDLGGDSVGARVLGRYREQILEDEYDMMLVLNANRPDTATLEKVVEYIESIEESSGLKISGIINNTHMLKETSVEDVLRGEKLASEVAKHLGITFKYTSCLPKLLDELGEDIARRHIPINLELRESWMS